MRSMSYTFAAAASVFDILFLHCIVDVEANFDVLLLLMMIVHRRSGCHGCGCDCRDATISVSIASAAMM